MNAKEKRAEAKRVAEAKRTDPATLNPAPKESADPEATDKAQAPTIEDKATDPQGGADDKATPEATDDKAQAPTPEASASRLRSVMRRPRWSTRREVYTLNAPSGAIIVEGATDDSGAGCLRFSRALDPCETGEGRYTDPATDEATPYPPLPDSHKAPSDMLLSGGAGVSLIVAAPTDPEGIASLLRAVLIASSIDATDRASADDKAQGKATRGQRAIRKAHQPTLLSIFGALASDPGGALAIGYSTPNPATDDKAPATLVAEVACEAGYIPTPEARTAFRTALHKAPKESAALAALEAIGAVLPGLTPEAPKATEGATDDKATEGDKAPKATEGATA